MLLLFLGAVLLAPHFDAHGITPEPVDHLIKVYGAKGTVDRLLRRNAAYKTTLFGDYDIVLDGVASGDARWLALVPRLDPGTDAGTGPSFFASP